MAGANYMGGKRNAVKARSKDIAGRAQKRFFGARRLDLARSLAPSHTTSNLDHSPSYMPRKGSSRMQQLDFGFTHSRTNSNGPSHKSAYIQSPTRPVKKSAKKRNVLAPSKVLEALDTSDDIPHSLRAAMDRVLAMPDLAGIMHSYRHSEPKNSALKRCQDSAEVDTPQECARRKRSRREPASPSPRNTAQHAYANESMNVSTSQPSSPSLSDYITDAPLKRLSFEHDLDDESEEASSTNGQYLIGRYNNEGSPTVELTGYDSPSPPEDIASTSESTLLDSKEDYALSEHLFDYANPWKAAGIIIGVESPPSEPLEKSWMLRDLDPESIPPNSTSREHSAELLISLEDPNENQTFFAGCSSSNVLTRKPMLSSLPPSSAGSYTESSPSFRFSNDDHHSRHTIDPTFPDNTSKLLEPTVADIPDEDRIPRIVQPPKPIYARSRKNVQPTLQISSAGSPFTLSQAWKTSTTLSQRNLRAQSEISELSSSTGTPPSGIGAVAEMLSEHAGRAGQHYSEDYTPRDRIVVSSSSSSEFQSSVTKAVSSSKHSASPVSEIASASKAPQRTPRLPLQSTQSSLGPACLIAKTVRFEQHSSSDLRQNADDVTKESSTLVPSLSLFIDEPMEESSESE